MKNPVLSLFHGVAPLFEKRLLRPLKPTFEATEAFFFSPSEQTLAAPFVRDAIDTKRYMMTVIFALVPIVLFSVFLFGPRVLVLIAVSYAAGGAVEAAFAAVRKEEISEGFLVTGILLPLTLPVTCPFWVVAAGSAFGVLIGKEIFGGTGHNPVNPAVTGRLFVFLAWPLHTAPAEWPKPMAWPAQAQLSTWIHPEVWAGQIPDAISSATMLTAHRLGDWADLSDKAKISLELMHGMTAGSVGGTSAILLLLMGIYLTWTRVANWRTMFSCLFGAWFLGAIMHLANPDFLPGWVHVVSGGLLFAAVFMVTDPVSGPVTNPARYVYGFMIGAMVVLGRNFGKFPDWIAFAIILMNLVAPLLDQGVWALRFRRLARCRIR